MAQPRNQTLFSSSPQASSTKLSKLLGELPQDDQIKIIYVDDSASLHPSLKQPLRAEINRKSIDFTSANHVADALTKLGLTVDLQRFAKLNSGSKDDVTKFLSDTLHQNKDAPVTHFDIMILDDDMPNILGSDAAEFLKSLNPKMKIISHSTTNTGQFKGTDGVLKKPVEKKDLQEESDFIDIIEEIVTHKKIVQPTGDDAEESLTSAFKKLEME